MEGSGHKFRTSPPILLATGVAIGLMLAAALFAAAPHFTATANQESGRTGALAYDVSDSTAPLSPPAPGTPDPAPVVVSSLSQLLPGLEAKVAAHPNDADLQILLARTYAELGQTEKAQALMESLHQHFPSNNGSVPFARAQALMEGEQSADLRKAIHLFEQSARNEPTLADRKSTRLNSSHSQQSRMPSSA